MGRGAAGVASAGLKIEGANYVQRIELESLVESSNRLEGNQAKKGPTKLHDTLQDKLTS